MSEGGRMSTTDDGIPASVVEHWLTMGPGGPIMLRDHYLIQRMAESNAERVPEGRVVPTQSSEASTAKEPIVSISPERQPLDHRAINHDLAVFTTHPIVGAGLPLWLPAGAVIRHELELFAAEIARHDGCVAVYSPVLAKRALFETSGHLGEVQRAHVPSDANRRGRVRVASCELPAPRDIYAAASGPTASSRSG